MSDLELGRQDGPRNGAAEREARSTRVIAVTSGKGGVGKTCFTANVAIALQRAQKRILVFDADLGLANIDVMLGLRPEYTLQDVLEGEKRIEEIIVRGPAGVDIMPGGSGIEPLARLSHGDQLALLDQLATLQGRYDIVLIDTGAGISSNVIYFILAAQASIVIVTPEPTSRTDAYALIKVLRGNHAQKRFQILVNQVESETEGRLVYRNLSETADRHLGDVSLGYLGCLTNETDVCHSIRRQKAAIELFPDGRFAAQIRALAGRVAAFPIPDLNGGLGSFWNRLLETVVEPKSV